MTIKDLNKFCLLIICLIFILNENLCLSLVISKVFNHKNHHTYINKHLYESLNVTRYPFILVPGDGGNQLYAKLNKTSAPHYFCELKTKDYFELWLNLEALSPYVVDCFIDNMRLNYDSNTRTSLNNAGVDIKIVGFGETETVEWLDSSKIYGTSYFAPLADFFVKNFNYTRGLNIRGAPFDWRRAPNELEGLFKDLTNLLIDTYEKNGNTKVILIGHSMGNPITLYWLNNYLTQDMKDKYIRAFVSLAPVLAGAVKTLRLMASGDNIDVAVVRPLNVRPYQRSAPSTAWLMPSPLFWSNDEILVSQPGRNYTVKDYFQFFSDLNYTAGYEMRRDTENLIVNLDPPNVEYHALYGVGVKTPESFYFAQGQWPDTQPSVLYGDGDGTVNIRSLRAYQKWFEKQKQNIFYKEIPGAEHLAILRNQQVFDYIVNLLSN